MLIDALACVKNVPNQYDCAGAVADVVEDATIYPPLAWLIELPKNL